MSANPQLKVDAERADHTKTAVQFLRNQIASRERDAPLVVRPKLREFLLTHPRFRHEDTVDLAAQAREYVQGRLPIVSREFAIAILLGCCEAGHSIPVIRSIRRLK